MLWKDNVKSVQQEEEEEGEGVDVEEEELKKSLGRSRVQMDIAVDDYFRCERKE